MHHVAGAAPSPISSPSLPGCSDWRRLAADAALHRRLPYRSAHLEAPGPNGPVPIRIYGPGSPVGRVPEVPAAGPATGLPGLGVAAWRQFRRRRPGHAGAGPGRAGNWLTGPAAWCSPSTTGWPATASTSRSRTRTRSRHGSGQGTRRGAWRGRPRGLCLGGASAGGNLAVGAAMYLKDAGLALPAKLLLAYPFLHAELPCEPAAVNRRQGCFPPARCRGSCASPRTTAGPWWRTTSAAPPGWRPPMPCPAPPTLRAAPVAVIACEYDDLRSSAEPFVKACGRPAWSHFRLEAGAPRLPQPLGGAGDRAAGAGIPGGGTGLGKALSMIEMPQARPGDPTVLGDKPLRGQAGPKRNRQMQKRSRR